MQKVTVSDKPFTIEELCQLSRPEATMLLREIERLLEEASCNCKTDTTIEKSSGCVFKDIGVPKPNGLDYFIDAPLLNENRSTSTVESCK